MRLSHGGVCTEEVVGVSSHGSINGGESRASWLRSCKWIRRGVGGGWHGVGMRGDTGHSAAAWADGSGHGGSASHDVGERRKEPVVVKGETDRWVPPANSNEFKNPNFVQTCFAPKVTFPVSKN
jgi:hypothetical protein